MRWVFPPLGIKMLKIDYKCSTTEYVFMMGVIMSHVQLNDKLFETPYNFY